MYIVYVYYRVSRKSFPNLKLIIAVVVMTWQKLTEKEQEFQDLFENKWGTHTNQRHHHDSIMADKLSTLIMDT